MALDQNGSVLKTSPVNSLYLAERQILNRIVLKDLSEGNIYNIRFHRIDD